MKYKNGEEFLNKIYTKMYLEDTVANHTKNGDTPAGIIGKYIERLEKIHDEAKDNNRKLHVLKQFYYKNYLIKELPENYIHLQKRILRERGYGNIEVSYNQREEWLKQIREEQKHSLDTWIDYLMSDDAMYPMWFKNYAFRGMLTLNKFDKEKESFGKRTSSTVEPFVDLNREALAMVYDILRKEIHTDDLTEEQESLLAKGESFKKLYTHYYINHLPKDMDKEIEGKYNQGEDYKPLWESLQGKNTGWCTAGEETCKKQIERGDFYVYYTKDEEGKYTNPRIAMRMVGTSRIGEVRGISSHQNLEENMTPIAEEKLKEFPDYERYKKKVSDMKCLTEIDYKTQKGIELTKEELRFLYEIDSKIEGFGYVSDPRIKEIQGKRNVKKDLAFVFDCKEENIATKIEDFDQHKIVAYLGDLCGTAVSGFEVGKESTWFFVDSKFRKEIKVSEKLETVKYIAGDVFIMGDVEFLENIEIIGGSLYFTVSKDFDGLKKLRHVGGHLQTSLLSINCLRSLETIGMSASFDNLKDARGLCNLRSIGGMAEFPQLEYSDGLEKLEDIGMNAVFSKLKDSQGLISLRTIGGNVLFPKLKDFSGLKNLQSIGREAYLKISIKQRIARKLGKLIKNVQLKPLTYVCGMENLVLINDCEANLYLETANRRKISR